ncbi:phosphate acyltransferase PlsX [Rhodobacter sp. SGA-6-6]|uniref:phosphate acyltransferase PlsX n=1 Tax=Rhodobacter sp. SGA-6-6 TaxID=2710882 RepID=UPI0013EE1280|nr:phosphate acyltransferase PlsX [Rhodobacter sp. SGA-6-6]
MAEGLQIQPVSGDASIVISVDAMGGDRGPAAVVAGLVDSARAMPGIRFLLHGDETQLTPLLARHPDIAPRVALRHAERVVSMEDKPSQVMRHGQGTSMWTAIDSVREGEAGAAVSCGNTGALMAVSMLRLRKTPGVNRPAIATLFPTPTPGKMNVMLDMGADVKADPGDLLQFAFMGASYARNGLAVARPRVGLLNVGTEEHKGRPELHEAHALLGERAEAGGFDYVGFIEGTDILSDRVDVIVTDGFTGNVALKAIEGTAKLVGELLRQSLTSTLAAKIGALISGGALRRLQRRIDPRRVNGGVFLGLNGTVVKSHGSADETGVSAAIRLAAQLAGARFHERLAARVASAGGAGQDGGAVDTGGRNGGPAGQGSDPTQ